MQIFDLDKFFGRRPILDLLKRRVLDLKEGYRQNIAFLGGRHVGKSIILQKFLADLDDDAIVPIYLDLENQDLDYLYYKYVGSILYHFAKIKRLPLNEDINLLIESTREYLPQTIKAIKKIQSLLAHEKTAEAYREIIALPQLFAQEADVFCVLMLDEFQDLAETGIPEVFQELGAKIMTQKRCLYVGASSLPAVAQRILSEKLSLLFGNFETIMVEPFDLKTSQDFITFNLGLSKITEPVRNFLVDFSGGQPLAMQLICRELVQESVVHKQQEIFLPLLMRALENILFDSWGVLSRHFDLLITSVSAGKGNRSLPAILVTLATGRQKINDLARKLDVKQSLLTPKMNRLVELGAVEKNGNFYYLPDKLLRYWVKYVFARRQKALDPDMANQRDFFREELARAFENFQASSQKDLPARIIELLHCFEDESYQIKGRRYKLPFFRQINSARLERVPGTDFDMIRASTSEGEWFIVLKPEMISESDINVILSESKRLVPKPQKCILISLSALDENARVRALQERMWIWNEEELNTLLNLYDKPYIV